MQVAFQITPEDYVAFTKYHFTKTPLGRRSQRRLYLLGLALYLAFAGAEYDHPQYGWNVDPGKYVLYLAVSAVMLGGVYAGFLWYIRPTLARTLVQQGERRRMLLPTRMTLHDAGMTIETDDGRGEVAWSRLRNVAQTQDHIFLLFPGLSAIIVPKSSFATAEDSRAFFEYARTHHAQIQAG
ncbi:MAG: YcxB family protein [Candidatus Hydrogenedentes bacterium]|nr:YcxB family protein [Candidatus Hydrogenedentota bacterium]